MPSTHRQSWFSLSRFARRSRKSTAPANEVRPRLETLEDRLAPAIATTTTISAGVPTFSLFDQTETVTTQTSFSVGGASVNVNTGQVTITDGGQTQTVNVNSNGQATATFKFNLLQEIQQKTFGSHAISASYSDSTGVFSSSTVSGTAPGNTTGFAFQLYFDFLLYQTFVASQQG